MRAAFLTLDDALAGQPALRFRAQEAEALEAPAADLGPALRLWSRPPALAGLTRRLRERLPASAGPRLVFAGSGDFHHATPTLVARALEAASGPVTIIHIDNHPDWVRYANGLHCGSWVGAAARLAGVSRVVTLGVCSSDVGAGRRREGDLTLVESGRLALYAYRAPDGAPALNLAGHVQPTIEAIGLSAFIGVMLEEVKTGAVYITIDKDVLRAEDAATNWDQGCMALDELLAILRAVMERHHVIGADVVGDWSKPAYGGGVLASMLKRAEALLDQPWRAPENADQVNEAVNLKLLGLFAEAA